MSYANLPARLIATFTWVKQADNFKFVTWSTGPMCDATILVLHFGCKMLENEVCLTDESLKIESEAQSAAINEAFWNHCLSPKISTSLKAERHHGEHT